MGFYSECPWCEETFESSKYPRSAGYSDVMKKKLGHMKESHEEKINKYNTIIQIWEEKTFDNNDLTEDIIKRFNFLLRRGEGLSKPDYDIVNNYEPEELEDLSEEEVRKIVDDF